MGESKSFLSDENLMELDLFLIECCENGGICIRDESNINGNDVKYIYDCKYEIYNTINNKDIILKIYNSVEIMYIEIKNYIKNIKEYENILKIKSVLGIISLESM